MVRSVAGLDGRVIARLAHRYGVTTVVTAGDPVAIAPFLPASIATLAASVRLHATHRDGTSSLARSLDLPAGIDRSRCLLLGVNLSDHIGADAACRTYAELEGGLRAIIAFDDALGFEGPPSGWVAGGRPWAPFGLDLPFSLHDARIPFAAPPPEPECRIIGIITVFNERDIVDICVRKLLASGVEVVVMDNWSTDGTYEMLSEMSRRGEIALERFPLEDPKGKGSFELAKQLARKEEISAAAPGAWIIHLDADEIRRSPWPDLTMKQAIWLAEEYGSNCIDFTVVNFRPVDEDWSEGLDPEQAFRFFELGEARDAYTRQVKAWKQGPARVSLSESAGHEVRFPARRLFPYNWILKHYPLRSSAHIRQKIFVERMPRFSVAERNVGWHSHYDRFAKGESLVWRAEDLQDADAPGFGQNIVTGVGYAPPEDRKPLQFLKANVWLAGRCCVVADVGDEDADCVYARIRIERLVRLAHATMETIEIVAATPTAQAMLAETGYGSTLLDIGAYIDGPIGPSARAYALARHLLASKAGIILFNETGGLASAALALKKQGLFPSGRRFVCILTGGVREALGAQGTDLYDPAQVEQDVLELRTVTLSDDVLAESAELASEWERRGVSSGHIGRVDSLLDAAASGPRPALARRVDELVFTGPIEGAQLEAFVAALSRVEAEYPAVRVTFAGPFGLVSGEHAGGFVVRRAAALKLPVTILRPKSRDELLTYLGERGRLAVLPRPAAHQALLGPMLAERGLPFLALQDAGSGASVADLLIDVLRDGPPALPGCPGGQSSRDDLTGVQLWLSGLAGKILTQRDATPEPASATPLVTVGIPHFERPDVLLTCLKAIEDQSYAPLEIIVVDDGSRKPGTLDSMREVEAWLGRHDGRVIYQPNAYLGAARNTVADHAGGEYIFFIDDDDYPLPHQIEYLVRAAQATGADIASSAVAFWDGGDVPATFEGLRAGNFPVGESVQLAFWKQSLGSACILVRRDSFEKIGRYTTDHGIGWEDYEFAFRSILEGFRYEAVPLPLYLYRVDATGMAATTPTLANGARLGRLIQRHADHPAMADVLRTVHARRVWEEAKTNRWASLHNQGAATRLYHLLLKDPPNANSASAYLVELAEVLYRPTLADQLRVGLLGGRPWHSDFAPPTPRVEPPGEVPDRARVTEQLRQARAALHLDRLGAGQEALSLLDRILPGDATAERYTLLVSGYLHGKHQRYEQAIGSLRRLLAEDPFDIEALFGLEAIMGAVSDVETSRLMSDLVQEAIVHAYDIERPSNSVESIAAVPLSPFEERQFEADPKPLLRFEVFPSEGLERRMRRRFPDWTRADFRIDRALVDHPLHCVKIDQFPGALYLHPRFAPGSVALARVVAREGGTILGLRTSLCIDGPAGAAAQIALLAHPTGAELDLFDLAQGLKRRASEEPGGPLHAALPWRDVIAGERYALRLEWDAPDCTDLIVAVRTDAASSEHRYAQVTLKGIEWKHVPRFALLNRKHDFKYPG